MLEVISVLNPDHINVVRLFELFEHMGQTCLAFEMLDGCLYDLLQERDMKPLSLNKIWPIAKQVCIIVRWNCFDPGGCINTSGVCALIASA